MPDGFSGPHLNAAFLCERVLQERDNVPSFIRVAERFFIPVPMGKLPHGIQVPPPILQTNLIISLKAGSLGTGKYKLRVKINKPDGSVLQDIPHSIFFNGSDDNGVLHGVPIVLVSPEEGLYWIDVYFEDSLMTRTPLRVLHQQIQLPAMQGPQE
jgi:hypothetical protein